MASLVLGLLASASVQAIALARTRAAVSQDRALAVMLARDLVDEIIAMPTVDPDTGEFDGPDAGEGGGTRENFDNIGDYDGWRSRPELPDGTEIPGYAGWERRVTINDSGVGIVTSVIGSDSVTREVVVEVYKGSRLMVSLSVVRSLAADESDPGLIEGVLGGVIDIIGGLLGGK